MLYRNKVLLLTSILIGLVAACLAFQSVDLAIFLDSSRLLLSGQSPYTISQFVYPVSMAAVLAPLSFLPLPLVFRAMILASVSIYAFVILRAARSWPIALLAILSPLFLYNFFYANLDWLVFAALLVNPAVAFLLALLKPQTGIGIAVIALIVVYRRNRLLAVLLLIAEIVIFAASFALGMHWSIALNHPGNTSIFPFGLIIGIPMMLLAIRRHDWLMALAATPLCSPTLDRNRGLSFCHSPSA